VKGSRSAALVRRAASAGVLGGLTASLLAAGGRAWWVLDLFTSFRAQYAALLAACTALCAALRSRRLALLGLLGLAANLGALLPLYRARRRARRGGTRLSVASWNVLVSNRRYDEVIGHVAALDADVVFLLEAGAGWARRLREARVPFTVHEPLDLPGSDILVLTRDPDVPVTVRLAEQRAIVEAAVAVDGTTVRVLGIHTSAPIDPAKAAARRRQLTALATLVRDATDPVVAVGDLNATPWSHDFRLLTDEGLIDSQRGFGLQPSWPVWAPPALRVPIDHAVHGPELVTVARSTGPAAGSDHRLLQVTLALR